LVNGEEKVALERQVVQTAQEHAIGGLGEFLWSFISLYLNHEDSLHARSIDYKRTVYIDNMGIGAVDFALDASQQKVLIQSGMVSILYDFYERFNTRTNTMNVSGRLLAYLLSQTPKKSIEMGACGLMIDHICFNIWHPKQIYELYCNVSTKEDRLFLGRLPLDLNVKDALGKIALYYAIEDLGKTEERREQVEIAIRHLLHEGIVDCNATIQAGESILDLALQEKEKHIWLIGKLLKKGAYRCSESSVLEIRKLLDNSATRANFGKKNKELREKFDKAHNVERILSPRSVAGRSVVSFWHARCSSRTHAGHVGVSPDFIAVPFIGEPRQTEKEARKDLQDHFDHEHSGWETPSGRVSPAP